MRTDAILFDLDGTLTDSIPLIVHCCRATFREFLGRDVPAEEIRPQIGRSLFELFDEYDAAQQPQMVAYYRALYTEVHDDWVTLFSGVETMLDELEALALPIGIVTSKSRASAGPALDRFGLRSRLNVLVTCDDTERHKPDPTPLLHAAELLRIDPKNCWYVGDATHDMNAALRAEMVAVGALWGASDKAAVAALANHRIESPKELLAIL